MGLVEEKDLIIQTLKDAIPEATVEDELARLFTEPEGKLVVLYNSAPYSKQDKIPYQSRLKIKRWTISITTRDPLKEDIALSYLEKIRTALHGLKIGLEDRERLFPDNERFEEFIEGTEVYAYKIDFVCEQVTFLTETNA